MEKVNNSFEFPVVSVRLVKDAPIFDKEPFNSPESAVRALGSVLSEFDREVLAVVNLKNDLTPVNVTFASIGTINATIAEPREIFKAAILSNASAMIVMHNHPSGKLDPSIEDVRITDRLVQVGALLGIPVQDHIIVGPETGRYFSFHEKGQMPESEYRLKTDYREVEMSATLISDRVKEASSAQESTRSIGEQLQDALQAAGRLNKTLEKSENLERNGECL